MSWSFSLNSSNASSITNSTFSNFTSTNMTVTNNNSYVVINDDVEFDTWLGSKFLSKSKHWSSWPSGTLSFKLDLKYDGYRLHRAVMCEYRFLTDENGTIDGIVCTTISEERLNDPKCLSGVMVEVFVDDKLSNFLITKNNVYDSNGEILKSSHFLHRHIDEILTEVVGEKDEETDGEGSGV